MYIGYVYRINNYKARVLQNFFYSTILIINNIDDFNSSEYYIIKLDLESNRNISIKTILKYRILYAYLINLCLSQISGYNKRVPLLNYFLSLFPIFFDKIYANCYFQSIHVNILESKSL